MTVIELKSVLSELPDDMPVNVIMDGEIDEYPDWNVCENAIYIEGLSHKGSWNRRTK